MSISAQVNWDDFRFVLAVADQGSVASASRVLGVNHATVLRRIAAFETRHGLKVFDKTPTGYRVSPDRRALVDALREAGDAVGQVERLIEAERPNLSTGIRVTSTDAFCQFIMPPVISNLRREFDTHISVLSGNAHLDFARLQADVTVRPAVKLPDELAGSEAAAFRFGVYAAKGGRDAWIGLEGAVARSAAGEWLRHRLGQDVPHTSSDSFIMLAGLAADGHGRTVLPVFVGDAWPGLTRVELLSDIAPTPIWVASHADLLHSGRLRRVRKVVAAALSKESARLMG